MRIIVFIVSFLFCCYFGLKANDTLTIRDAFNWKVGDTLIYKEYRCATIQPGPGAPYQYSCSYFGNYGFRVNSRTNLTDTIIYICQWFTGETDTIVITGLDTDVILVGNSPIYDFLYNKISTCQVLEVMITCADSVLISNCSINSYTDTITNLLNIDIDMLLFETGYTISYLEKSGIKDAGYYALEFFNGMSGGCGFSLIYHKSDSTMWVDSLLLYTGINDLKTDKVDFNVYPNPTNNNFTITLPPSTKQITITNKLGQVVQTHETGREEKQLQVSLPESGTYFVHVTTESAIVTKKVICIEGFK